MNDIYSNTKLVNRINELFHDMEEDDYNTTHPEIFTLEKENWDGIIEKHIKGKEFNNIIDYGCGTGFVPLTISPHLNIKGSYYLCDISEKKLEIAKKSLSKFPKIQYRFVKTESIRVDLPDDSLDLITLNSVLHHLPNYPEALAEFQRLLRPGGILMIVHEPNRLFARNILIRFLNIVFNPRQFAFDFLIKTNLYDRVVKYRPQSRFKKIGEEINKTLVVENILHKPLLLSQIFQLIDVHVFTGGFDPFEIHRKYLANFQSVDYRTYFYLERSNKLDFLNKLFPKSGSEFYAIWQKQNL